MDYLIAHRHEVILLAFGITFLVVYYIGWIQDRRQEILMSLANSWQEIARQNTIRKRGYK